MKRTDQGKKGKMRSQSRQTFAGVSRTVWLEATYPGTRVPRFRVVPNWTLPTILRNLNERVIAESLIE